MVTKVGHIGMFGYPSSVSQLIIESLVVLKAEVASAELWLIGAPGPDTEIGWEWREAAARADVESALRFTGTKCSDELVRAIDECDVAIFHDGFGPSSRKTTLAALLAAGTPVVAVDGANTWRALVEEGAVSLVEANSVAIAAALAGLIGDTNARLALGAQGTEFYRKYQSRTMVVGKLAGFLGDLV